MAKGTLEIRRKLKSIKSTRIPRRARLAAVLTMSEVLPTPPL